MFLKVNMISLNNNQPNFGAKIPTKIAKQIIEGKDLSKNSQAVYSACESIVGPEVFNKGIMGVIGKCADVIKKQVPDLLNPSAKLGKEIEINSIYTETSETQRLLRRMNTVRNANRADIYNAKDYIV